MEIIIGEEIGKFNKSIRGLWKPATKMWGEGAENFRIRRPNKIYQPQNLWVKNKDFGVKTQENWKIIDREGSIN